LTIIFFILGAIIASFVGVVVVRLNTGHSIVSGRSRCDACGTILAPFTLVPVISFFVSGGRARCCGARISLYAPLTELILGGLFVLAYVKLGLGLALPLLMVALSLLLGLVLYDLMHQILPPVLLYSFVAVALAFRYVMAADLSEFVVAFLWAGGITVFFVAMHVLSRGRAMGLGDAPLSFGLAMLVGAEYALTGLAFSFWIGAIVGITILLQRPKGSRMGVEVPFAPYLAAGFLLAYFIQCNLFALMLSQ